MKISMAKTTLFYSFLMLISVLTFGQVKKIQGTISDQSNQPLPGVNIVIKGTANGTATNIDGKYSIQASTGDVLVFSYIGFIQQQIKLTDQSSLNVVLHEDITSLSEMIVIGYGSQKKGDLTGSVSTVETEDMQKLATPSIGEALQGRAAGVMVMKSSGKPGAGAEIKIRGVNSINGTDPLWVVDGVKGAPAGNLDEIESISILKDAAAAAIYGKDAANGVIIVTTKRGSKDKQTLKFHAYNSWNTTMKLPTLLNSNQMRDAKRMALENGGISEKDIDSKYAYYWQDWEQSTDWFNEMLRTGKTQNYNLSASGGSEKANYFISGNVLEQSGTIIENDYSSYDFRVNSDIKINDWLKVGETMQLSHSNENPLSGNAQGSRIYKNGTRALPMMPVYDETNIIGGGFGYIPDSITTAQWNGSNPVAALKLYDGFNKKTNVYANVYAEITPIAGLVWRTSLAGRFNNSKNEDLDLPFKHSASNMDLRNKYSYELAENSNYFFNSYVSYYKEIDKHSISIMQGAEAEKREGSAIYTEAWELASLNVLDTDLTNNLNSKSSSMNKTHGAEYGYFGRLSYDYDGKYLFQANYRYDGSAKFGRAYSTGLFPSFSVGWRLSSESFLQSQTWLYDLKLRAGWGILGIDNIPSYRFAQYYRTYGYQDFGGSLMQGSHIKSIPNESIKWEEVEQFNLGIDFSMFENKLYGSLEYYSKVTNDMLINFNIPTQTGFSDLLGNKGEIKNTGVDVNLNYRQRSGDFVFTLSANAGYMKNEVLNLFGTADNPNIVYGSSDNFTPSRSEVGQPLASFYGYVADGLITTQEQLDALNAGASNGIYQMSATTLGDILYKDLNGDGKITALDQQYIGQPWPKWNFGLNFSLEYKNFDFNMFWSGVTGLDIFNDNKVYMDKFFGDANTSTNVLNAWSPENPTGTVPRLTVNDPNENFGKESTYFIEDGSYLRLKNIQLGYTLPKSIANTIKMQNLRFYVSAINLLTFTKYSGVDPEFVTSGSNNVTQMVDQSDNYPQYKSFTVGIQVEF
jgi:TonB-dependent starch-binding outer membrane protein SusC